MEQRYLLFRDEEELADIVREQDLSGEAGYPDRAIRQKTIPTRADLTMLGRWSPVSRVERLVFYDGSPSTGCLPRRDGSRRNLDSNHRQTGPSIRFYCRLCYAVPRLKILTECY
ncbi:hypothetical protein [Roseomonas sp. FDAARGOS_362]|uniref:hypothetical protein n=1 Tax=Roseomonas sp. FDAARGOS_362 TaxID=2018065 RepID=UPI001D00DA08|nr:hypothetical protein [Roseomonas sp. FDAARGOS_362]